MEINDLKTAWAMYDKKLSASLELNEQLLRSINLEKLSQAVKKPLNLELVNVVIQFLAVGMVTVMTLGLSAEIPYLIIGIISALLCATSLVFSAAKASRFYRLLNYDLSITAYQEEFSLLRILIIRLRKIESVLAGLIGVTLFPLMIKAVAGVDLMGNLVFVIAGILLTTGIGYAVGSWLNLFIYDKGLKDAEKFLEIVKQYRKEA